jgi:hypothetical protein
VGALVDYFPTRAAFPNFSAAGLTNNGSGSDILRHLFVLLTGVGVRESSGRYCMGRYMQQNFSTADSAEAGLFQASFDVTTHCKTILANLFAGYTANPSGFLDTFKVGITCNAQNWKNWGDPTEPGYKFQQLTKTCPAFAAEVRRGRLAESSRHLGIDQSEDRGGRAGLRHDVQRCRDTHG